MDPINLKPPATPSAPEPARRMVPAELFGRHTHTTDGGLEVHIWARDGKYLARGRLDGRQYLETLGADSRAAEGRLYNLLAELDSGAYVRRSEVARRPLRRSVDLRLNLRKLIDDFLYQKRRLRGQRTANTYSSRLAHAIAFSEEPANRRRWPLARDVDGEFALALKVFLVTRRTTPNGRIGATAKVMSARQGHNVLDCLRSVFHWAARPDVGKLPAAFVNPLSAEIVGQPPAKDPLRPVKLPTTALPSLVGAMDEWQLCHLGLLCLLPCRPDEFAGLLIGDVDFGRRVLTFGTRLGGSDFTKTRQAFSIPFPTEAEPLLRALVGGRVDGPLLRKRAEFARPVCSSLPKAGAVAAGYGTYLAGRPGSEVQTEQDQKRAFRRFLGTLGGLTTDHLNREFKRLVGVTPGRPKLTVYALRETVTQGMKDSGMPHVDLRYLTSHSANDIINTYAAVDIFGSMAKYFGTVPGVLAAVAARAREFGLAACELPPAMSGPIMGGA